MSVDAAAKRAERATKLLSMDVTFIDGEEASLHTGRPCILDANGKCTVSPVERGYFQLADSKGHCIERDRQLTTLECLHFLFKYCSDKDTLFFTFKGWYDVQQILRQLSDLPASEDPDAIWHRTGNYENEQDRASAPWSGYDMVKHLLTNTDRTQKDTRFSYAGQVWAFKVMADKKYVFRRLCTTESYDNEPHSEWKDQTRTVTLWDIQSYFATGFVPACEEYQVAMDRALLVAGKAHRSANHINEADKIRRYNAAEGAAAELLMKKLIQNCVDAGRVPSSWHGPGALASDINDEHNVKAALPTVEVVDPVSASSKKPKMLKAKVLPSKEIQKALAIAFAGGRIEVLRVGEVEGVRDYDRASAYPAEILLLPSMVGTYELISGTTEVVDPRVSALDGEYRLYHVRWDFPRGLPFYPFHYRTEDHAVIFPASGETWTHDLEVFEAVNYCERFNLPAFEVLEYVAYRPEDKDARPFSFIQSVYDQRLEWKQKDAAGNVLNPAEHILKLCMNSQYGKSAQLLGAIFEIDVYPEYFDMFWAGRTTSGTRASLLRVACALENPEESLVMFMTDGVFCLEDVPEVLGIEHDNSKKPKLGSWGVKRFDKGVSAQAGVYWLWSKISATDEAGNEILDEAGDIVKVPGWVAKCRGFSLKNMKDPSIVTDVWKRGDPKQTKVEVHCQRFVSMRSSLVGNWKRKCTWEASDPQERASQPGVGKCPPRVLDISGNSRKREANPSIFIEGIQSVALPVKANEGYEEALIMGEYLCSFPYDKVKFEEEKVEYLAEGGTEGDYNHLLDVEESEGY
jgi:hypothetical protein